MSDSGSTLVRRLLNGFLVVLPLYLIVFVVDELIGIVDVFAEPVRAAFPRLEFLGEDMSFWASLAILLAIFVVIGWVGETRLGKAIGRWLERSLLDPIPGYDLIKGLTTRFGGRRDDTLLAPVVVARGDGSSVLGFEVDENADGTVTVFVPIAPTPSLGMVEIVPADRVRVLDASAGAVANCLLQWGIGSREVLADAPPNR